MKLLRKTIGSVFGLRRRFSCWLFVYAALLVNAVEAGRFALHAQETPAPTSPTFYRDVLPILQQRCQVCHRSGGIAPMAFQTYSGTRPYAAAIAQAAEARTMPPWFAEKGVGRFTNDPSLTEGELGTLLAWVKDNTPAANAANAPT